MTNCKRSVLGTMAIEGLSPSKQGENITDLFLNGRIDSNTAIEQIIKFHIGGTKRAKEDKVIKDKRAGKITVSQANRQFTTIKKGNSHRLK